MNAAYIRNRMFEGSCWNLKVSPSWLGDCLIGGQHQSWRPTSRLAKPQDSSVEAAKHQPPNNKQSSKPSNTLRPAPPAFTNASSLHTVPEPSQTEFHLGSDPQSSDMDASELRSLLKQLHNFLATHNYSSSKELLSRAKLALLELDALVPTASTSTSHLLLARETLELGALISIRLQDPEAFTRYFQQLQPFYSLPSSQLPRDTANASKITGLYLLLLLSQGDYAGFHTLLEALEVAAAQAREQGQQEGDGGAKSGKGGLDEDAFIQYPIRLEQALMEGSYDRVWGETKSERVPSEEFGVFSEVLIGTIRSEIASCSERAYASLPIVNAKNLFFLDSEGSVIQFARNRGWTVQDGRIYFPQEDQDLLSSEKASLVTSRQVIANTLGYARDLETIV